ncbi:MAG: Zn-dependent hydrolase, partial [Planctomycetes bacterium]|nr:Zn-dependent hydrolase [Planctomycetota bacterium]
MQTAVQINVDRLNQRLDKLAEIGPIPGNGSCRIALTDEDKAGRDLFAKWATELGMEMHIDQIGNMIAIR